MTFRSGGYHDEASPNLFQPLQDEPFMAIVQTWKISILFVVIFPACAFPTWTKVTGEENDAGDSGTAGHKICAPSKKICFEAPQLTSVSWGLTAISLGPSRPNSNSPSVIVTAYGSSEVVELQAKESQIDEVNQLKVAVAPWQALGGAYNMDGKEEYLVVSPGSPSEMGVLSMWCSTSTGSWSNALTQAVGVGTFGLAARSDPVSAEVVAIAASYNAQTILPLVAHNNDIPTVGKPLTIELEPTAAEFSADNGASARLFVVGSTSGRGGLIVFDVLGENLSQIAKSQDIGTAPNDVKLGDLNGDAVTDAIVIDDSEQSEMFSLLGDATNNWTVASQISLPAHSHAAALADFDHDGNLDTASISGSTTTIQVCFGDGKGSFGDCTLVPHALEQPTDIVAADVDSDGWTELLSVGYEGRLSSVLVSPMVVQ